MCLLVLAWEFHPRYRLVVAANRDEFHGRASAPLSAWEAPDRILAGRDLQAGGTWLGIDAQRRFGAVTNFRELQPAAAPAPTRGRLVPEFLRGSADPAAYLRELEPVAADYCGFNLLLADRDSLWYASNRTRPFARPLEPGVYALSNDTLDTPWPKVRRVRTAFEQWLRSQGSAQELFAMLADRTRVTADDELPVTGVPAQWERVLSSPFVLDPRYGTRCSTVVLIERSTDALVLSERRFDPWGELQGGTELTVASGTWPGASG